MAHGNSPRHARKPRKARATKPARATAPADDAKDDQPARGRFNKVAAKPVPEAPDSGAQRLQKLLAAAGFGSRRDVEQFLIEERVTVNGRVASLGAKANPLVDEIRVDGERLAREKPAYWILNKPRGVITTVRDDEGRRTVMDLLPRKVGRLFPVGRLDLETSGLVLMTNDGDVAHALLHPSLGNEREYRVNVRGELDAKAIGRLAKGVSLEEGKTAKAQVDDVRYDADSQTTSLSLTLVEGKKRQIRRSLLVLGFPVRRLVRVRMGPVRIGRLAVGDARPLRSEEKRALLEHVRRLRAGEPVAAQTRSSGNQPELAPPPKRTSTRRSAGSKPRRKSPPAGPKGAGAGRRPPSGPRSAGGAGTGRPPAGPRGASVATGGRPPSGPRAEASRSTRSGPKAATSRSARSGPGGPRKKAARKKSAGRKSTARRGPKKAARKKSAAKRGPAKGGARKRPASKPRGGPRGRFK